MDIFSDRLRHPSTTFMCLPPPDLEFESTERRIMSSVSSKSLALKSYEPCFCYQDPRLKPRMCFAAGLQIRIPVQYEPCTSEKGTTRQNVSSSVRKREHIKIYGALLRSSKSNERQRMCSPPLDPKNNQAPQPGATVQLFENKLLASAMCPRWTKNEKLNATWSFCLALRKSSKSW
jgi:hypothetical protein